MEKEYLRDYLLVNTSQYFVDEEIEDKVLDFLIEKVLWDYGKYKEYRFRDQFSFQIGKNDFKYDNKGRRVRQILGFWLYRPELTEEFKVPFSWNIDTGSLQLGFGGTFIVKYLAYPLLEDIDRNDREFLNLMLGAYMMYIGEARKMFTLNGVDFENDGAELYQQGAELYSETLENLSNNLSNWYFGVK